MKKLAKNTVYVIVIYNAYDGYNTYGKVVNAYKITNGIRTYLNISNERVNLYTGDTQMAKEYLRKQGFEVPMYLSDAQNLVTIEKEVKYRQLK